jgi:RNA polymerase sigma factor (TIGR02999 family)
VLRSEKLTTIPVSDPGDVTQLLSAAGDGERPALDALFTRVYEELRSLATHQLAGRNAGGTLSGTVLVHEAYLKLVDGAPVQYRDRRHFFALAARAMRQIVLDYARRARAQKRGGDGIRVVLDEAHVNAAPPDADAAELIALDDALTELERFSSRLARIVELRFFAGLSVEESAEVLDISARTVKREWRKARAFLFQALGGAATLQVLR